MARIIKKGNKYLVPVRVTYPRRIKKMLKILLKKGKGGKNKMVRKKVNTLVEARAIKKAYDDLNKKLGLRKRAKIKRTRDLKFLVN